MHFKISMLILKALTAGFYIELSSLFQLMDLLRLYRISRKQATGKFYEIYSHAVLRTMVCQKMGDFRVNLLHADFYISAMW